MTAQASLFAAHDSCAVCGRTRAEGALELRPDPHLGLVCEGCRQGAGFDGAAYNRALDHERLTGQIRRVFDVMKEGRWQTPAEVAGEILERFGVQDPIMSVDAQRRNLKKARFGAWTIHRRRRGDPTRGLFEYRLDLGDRRDLVQGTR